MPLLFCPIRFRAARELAGISRIHAAGLVGLSHKSIQNYEAGRTEPQVSTFLRLAEIYGVQDVRHLLKEVGSDQT